MLWNAVLLALKEMKRNKMRTFLTMLGIVIGVSAVVTMVTLGNGATKSVSDQIASLGNNLVIAMPGQRMGASHDTASAPNFKIADAEAIRTQISNVRAVAPTVTSSVMAVAAAKNWTTSAVGSTNAYFITSNWTMQSGRIFDDTEEHAGKSVCILGETVRKNLFGTADPVGSRIRVKDFSCDVIGLLKAKGQSSMGRDHDDMIVLPLRTVQRRLAGSLDVGEIMVAANDGASTSKLKSDMEQLLRERRHITSDKVDDFNVMDTKEIATTMSSATRVLTSLLGAVAAVSLLVGGIGIMNIMLVSITERTREIGTRLAIGALEREVLLQFMVEAVTLSIFGGTIGIVLATLASVGLAAVMQMPYVFSPMINIAAFGISACIGVVFGYVPAKRAARLDPIEALRHE